MTSTFTGSAIVTGAGSGIGRAVAHKFLAKGVRVTLVGRGEEALRATAADHPDACLVVPADIAVPEHSQRVVDKAVATWGAVDILVNSAGIWQPNPLFAPDSVDVFDRVIATNLRGTYLMCRAASSAMGTRGGAIVNISSLAGVVGLAESSAYAASKAGVVQLSRSLAAELAPSRIRVNVVAPGNVETPINAMVRTPEYRAVYERLRALTPSGRVYIDPEEIAEIVLFLASPAASALAGAVIVADDGFSASLPSLKE